MDEAGVRKVIAENNRALLVEIKDLVNSSMSEIKRLKRDSAPQFNKKSNEELTKLLKMPLKTPRLHSKGTMSRRPNKP